MIFTVDNKRRLSVPASFAPIKPGDAFTAQFDADEDMLVFRRVSRNGDWLEVLKSCPVAMDGLPPRRREYPKRRKL